MSKFNQMEYIREYNKEHYKVFKVNLLKEEMEVLESYLKKKGISKAQFLREAMIQKGIRTNVLTNKWFYGIIYTDLKCKSGKQ